MVNIFLGMVNKPPTSQCLVLHPGCTSVWPRLSWGAARQRRPGIRAQMAQGALAKLGYANVVNGMTWLQVQETIDQLPQ